MISVAATQYAKYSPYNMSNLFNELLDTVLNEFESNTSVNTVD